MQTQNTVGGELEKANLPEKIDGNYGVKSQITDSTLESNDSFDSYMGNEILTPEQEKVFQALQKAKIDPNEKLEPDPVLLEIDGKPISTLGNFLLIIGKAKSKKTFFVLLLLAAVLYEKKNKISGHKFSDKKRIIWFDTEQARFHVSKAFNRLQLLHDGKINEYEIEVYDLRPYAADERKAMIDFVLNEQNPANDIAFVVIDGLRDTLFDINSSEEASRTIGWLLKLTEEKKLHITTILHENKNDKNPRGHIGTEAMNKAETTLSIIKDPDVPEISIVKAEYMREQEIDPIAFRIDSSGLPFIIEDYVVKGNEEVVKKKSILPHTTPDETHSNVLKIVFQDPNQGLGYSELVRQVKLEFEVHGIAFGMNKAKDFVSYFKKKKWVTQIGEGSKVKYMHNSSV